MEWPEQVPVFDKTMIHQEDTYDEIDGKHCVVGWLQELFLHLINPEGYGGYYRKNYVEALKEFKKHAKGVKKYYCVEEWGDSPERSKEEIADTLNKTMVGLGYTEQEEVLCN